MADDLNAPINTPTQEDTWTTGLDGETVGFLQSRGWDKLDAKEAAGEAIKAYRNAAKLMGAPPDQIVRLPREDDLQDRQQFWRRLGAPEKPEDYDFSGIDWNADAEMTKRFTDAVRATAVELNVPKEMAERLARTIYDWSAKETTDAESQMTIRRDGELRELYASWGGPDTPTYKANQFLVDRASQTLGIDKETGDAIAETIGLAKFSRLMHQVGLALGEDKFVTTDAPTAGGTRGPMTREQMMNRLAELKSDKDWSARLFKGDKDVKREFDDLTRALAR